MLKSWQTWKTRQTWQMLSGKPVEQRWCAEHVGLCVHSECVRVAQKRSRCATHDSLFTHSMYVCSIAMPPASISCSNEPHIHMHMGEWTHSFRVFHFLSVTLFVFRKYFVLFVAATPSPCCIYPICAVISLVRRVCIWKLNLLQKPFQLPRSQQSRSSYLQLHMHMITYFAVRDIVRRINPVRFSKMWICICVKQFVDSRLKLPCREIQFALTTTVYLRKR